MAHDWAQDVKKYASSSDEAAIKGIVKHLGIAERFIIGGVSRQIRTEPRPRSLPENGAGVGWIVCRSGQGHHGGV